MQYRYMMPLCLCFLYISEARAIGLKGAARSVKSTFGQVRADVGEFFMYWDMMLIVLASQKK